MLLLLVLWLRHGHVLNKVRKDIAASEVLISLVLIRFRFGAMVM